MQNCERSMTFAPSVLLVWSAMRLQLIKSPEKADPNLGVENGWPVGYFSETAGMFVGEQFECPDQGMVEERDQW